MPRVLATGYMVGLFEWACIQAMNPHLDWPREQSVGIGVHLSHVAATPPGLTVTIQGELLSREGKRLEFALQGHDGVELISEGTHQRYVIDAERFNAKASGKGREGPWAAKSKKSFEKVKSGLARLSAW